MCWSSRIINQKEDNRNDLLKIDDLGLGDLDRKIIHKFYNNGQVGVKIIALNVGEEIKTLEDEYESFLTRIGFLKMSRERSTKNYV